MDELHLELEASPPTEPPLNGRALPGPRFDLGPGDLGEVDWETTRYLAAAAQLDPAYARQVVRRIIGEPFRAVAPAAGADVVTVTRWALAALQRQAEANARAAEVALREKRLDRRRIQDLITKITAGVLGVATLTNAIDAVQAAVTRLFT